MSRQLASQSASRTAWGLVQVVHLRWTKASRGGTGARQRNGVPQTFPISADEVARDAGGLTVVVSRWSEDNGFAQPVSTTVESADPVAGFACGPVRLTALAEGLEVRCQGECFLNPRTEYWESPDRRLVIAAGSWGQIVHNERFSCHDTGNWWYEQWTTNVAWFAGPNRDGRVFVDRSPSEVWDLRRKLR